MTFLFWLLLISSIGIGAWGFHRYRLQSRKIRKLKESLIETNKRMHAREEDHQGQASEWESTEAKLRRYLHLLDTLINSMPNPIYFKDKDGYYQGCNNVFAKQILDLTRDNIIGKRPQELTDHIPPDLAAIYQREENKVTLKGGAHIYEAQVQCADGQRRDFMFSVAPMVDELGKQSGSVTVLSDLTEKNRAAQVQLQKEKLEGVLETAGAVCHELNQPLQAISGYTELMAVQLNGHKAGNYIEKLTAQIDRMRDITDKLQNITRVEVTDYAGDTKIIDIHKSSSKTPNNES